MKLFSLLCIVVAAASAIPGSICASHPRLPHKSAFSVDGKHLPGVSDFIGDIGTTYSGLLPITDKGTKRETFFFFTPIVPEAKKGHDDLIIWLNGGPGCSSLIGAFTENGPFQLVADAHNRTIAEKNEHAWRNFANVLYIENPIGTGFSTSKPDITNENEMATELWGFLKNFFSVFPEMRHKKVTIVGESYGSFYSIYGTARLLDEGVNVGGFGIVSGVITDYPFFQQAAWIDYIHEHNDVLGLNQTYLDAFDKLWTENDVPRGWVPRHIHYPPKGKIIMAPKFISGFGDIDPYFYLADALYDVNNCFNIYHITEKCPQKGDPLTGPSLGQFAYDNFITEHPKFKEALHAPPKAKWRECAGSPVFVGGKNKDEDLTLAPASSPFFGKTIDRVVKQGGRALVIAGDLDLLIPAASTTIGLQNITWGHMQGYQSPPHHSVKVGGKPVGSVQSERGLTYAILDKSGHMAPRDAPLASEKLAKYLLGQIEYADLIH